MRETSSQNVGSPDQTSYELHIDDVANDHSLMGFSADLFSDIALVESFVIVPPLGITQSNDTTAPDFIHILSQSNVVHDLPFGDTSKQSPDPMEEIVHQPGPHLALSAKPKRRRMDGKFTNPGPNRFGRKGTIRCERCRHWRRRCEYDEQNLNLPCTLCKERGFDCTSEHKKWGPRKECKTAESCLVSRHLDSIFHVFRAIATPDDEQLTPPEWRNIQQFYALWVPKRYNPLQFPSALDSRIAIPLYNVGIAHSSYVYRIAILMFMSYINGYSNSRTFEYLGKFYQQAQKCINNRSVMELVYSSYVVAIYSLIGGVSRRTAIDHCRQFCLSFAALESWMVDEDELMWLETLWQKVLLSLYHVHRDSLVFEGIHEPVRLMESADQLQQLLRDSSSLLPSLKDVSTLRLSMTTKWICQKVISLAIYMQYYFDQFLFLIMFGADAERKLSVQSELHDIADRIVHLIPQLSNIRDYIYDAYPTTWEMESCLSGTTYEFLNFPNVRPRGLNSNPKERDTALALLYTFSQLIKDMLEVTEDVSEKSDKINNSAIALCRICASFPKRSVNPLTTLLVKRSLFWAGLILTKSRFPQGNPHQSSLIRAAHIWIKSKLQQCIRSGYHWGGSVVIDNEEEIVLEMMNVSDLRISVDDIWTVTVENISVFQYNSTLATWFFGLNLVRFEYKSRHGRSLEIF